MSARPVITGIGLFTPVGRAVDTVWDAVCAGKSGIRQVPADHRLAPAIEYAGFAPGIDASEVLPPAEGRLVDRFVLMALAAAADAMADAGLTVGTDVDPDRVAVVVSSGAGGLDIFEEQSHAYAARGRTAVSPYMLPGFLGNMAAARIAIQYGAHGFSSAMSTACSAGAHAIVEAFRLIAHGDADMVICGASEAPLNPTGSLSFRHGGALATRWSDPTAASRPFDVRRNGFVLAEGAGILVVERASDVDARGAAGYADLLGWGVTTDAYRPTTPLPDGACAAKAMAAALRRADLPPGEVDYVNAHGTSTKLGDVAEVKALRTVFGAVSPAVSSTKSVTGHLLGGSGAVEAAITALAVSRGVLPPTYNLDEVDPECEADHVREQPRTGRVRNAISNSFAFGGHNVSLLMGEASTRRRRTAVTDG
ncbi:beta-ketoacyl-[acyl-carrier-protein] synthase family protein [Micromonospora ureilytica]|uniref:beta-ketoacyl-[acyl-carrier-protein] synthase family protein n=1 Tax=Micromonospora ureilytica TaxID=709868 RepID=UPI0033DC6800